MWENEKLIRIIVKESFKKMEVLNKLGLKSFTGNYDTLNKYIRLYNIDISHFNRKINKVGINLPKIDLEKILTVNSLYNRTKLKGRLYKEGLKERKCEMCGQGEEWNGRHMSLILDHINGIYNDNRLENLRIVCPNCNATLDTHCGKNVQHVDKKEYNKQYRKLHRKKVEKKIYNKDIKYCKDCNKELSIYNKNGVCISCSNKIKSINNRKVERPSYDQLLSEIKELGYCGTGRKYNVSDNTIRKWLKRY